MNEQDRDGATQRCHARSLHISIEAAVTAIDVPSGSTRSNVGKPPAPRVRPAGVFPAAGCPAMARAVPLAPHAFQVRAPAGARPCSSKPLSPHDLPESAKTFWNAHGRCLSGPGRAPSLNGARKEMGGSRMGMVALPLSGSASASRMHDHDSTSTAIMTAGTGGSDVGTGV
jgi:hypothetical protein